MFLKTLQWATNLSIRKSVWLSKVSPVKEMWGWHEMAQCSLFEKGLIIIMGEERRSVALIAI